MFDKSKILIVSVALVILVIVSLIGAPFLNNLFAGNSDPFSELWILGPEHTAENYPYNITVNQEYGIYLGVDNQLNQDATYSIHVKLCTNMQQLPNSTTAEPSPLTKINDFEFTLSDEETWETNFIFALDYALIQQNLTQIEDIRINGATFTVNRNTILDSDRDLFYVFLVFELWSNNGIDTALQYTNQYLQLFLKLE